MQRLDDRSRMSGDVHVRFCESLKGRFLWATRLLVLSKTRWHNRQAIKVLNQVFGQLKISKHPDKTFIGKIEKGFDFLGYHFSLEPLQLAHQTVRRHVEHINRLYEQQVNKKATSEEMAFVLGTYVKRWLGW